MHLLQSVSLGAVIVSGIAGCGLVNELPGRSFHQRCGWKAEVYFTDRPWPEFDGRELDSALALVS